MGKMDLPPIGKNSKRLPQGTGNLNLPPVERKQRTQTNPDFVNLPSHIIPPSEGEGPRKIHISSLNALNKLNQLKLFTPGKLFYTLNTSLAAQTLTVYAPEPDPDLENYLFGTQVISLTISRTGLQKLHIKEKTVSKLEFKDWLQNQFKKSLEAFSQIHHNPTPEQIGEWVILNLLTIYPENTKQTSHIVLAATDFITKIRIVSLVDYDLPQEVLDSLKIEDETGIFAGSLILMSQQHQQKKQN